MKSHARVVVIGGGVMGASLIYHLTQLGWRDVVLLEKNELTAGSTWHAAGLCTHYARNKKLTPAYHTLKRRGAVFGSVYGFERPNWYSPDPAIDASTLSFRRANWFDTVAAECLNLQQNVGLADLSAFSKFRVSGNDAFRFIDQLGANAAPRVGRVGLMHALTPGGGVASEFSVTRLAEQEFYLVSAAAAGRHDEDLLRLRARAFDLGIDNVTDDRGVLGIMGPNAQALLQSLCDQDLSLDELPWLSARAVDVAGIRVDALRVSYVGEPGFELHHDIVQQQALLGHLLQAEENFELGFYGAFAMNAMRLEKGYRAWGADLTTERTPLEAGLGYLVKTEDREFIGRQALLERAQAADHWSMELIELDAPEFDPFYMHTVFRQGRAVGMVTSGSYGHRLQKAIALAYFRTPIANADALEVEILGRPVPARITSPL
ncbi:MAG: aminomethyl transferase family protein [Gammaproteobacteria bacterium]|nr:aminomethyl transferase family protein [Gammaproteobacteria bacterium]